MADGSTIEWLNRPGTKPATWNPVRGCTRVSEGCVNCYAETMAARFSEPGQWGHGFAGTVRKPGGGSVRRWTGKVELIEEMLTAPLRWRTPRTIFVNSTSDLFHEKLPDAAIDRIFAVMALCGSPPSLSGLRPSPPLGHTFLILTKRPERMRAYLSAVDVAARIALAAATIPNTGRLPMEFDCRWPLPNVWLGTSIEDRPTGIERAYHLANTPAAIRFWSVEPLLADLGDLTGMRLHDTATDGKRCVDWIIVGGESGSAARPMHPAWARSIRDQCRAAGTAFFFKQWGAWAPRDALAGPDFDRELMDGNSRELRLVDSDGRHVDGDIGDRTGFSDDARFVYRVGKKAAGRLLDGRTWSEFPAPAPNLPLEGRSEREALREGGMS